MRLSRPRIAPLVPEEALEQAVRGDCSHQVPVDPTPDARLDDIEQGMPDSLALFHQCPHRREPTVSLRSARLVRPGITRSAAHAPATLAR